MGCSALLSNKFKRDYEAALQKHSDMLCARLIDKKQRQYEKKNENIIDGCVNIEMKLKRIRNALKQDY